MVERTILVIGSGVLVGVLGTLIKYAGMMHLIAGYDSDQVTDEEGLADFIGTHTLVVAALTVCVGVLELWEPTDDSEWHRVAFVIGVVAIAVRMVRGARHYRSPSERNQTS